MEKFYHKLAHLIGKVPEPQFNKKDWQKLESLLDQGQKPKSIIIPFFWPLLFLASFGFSSFYISVLSKENEKLSTQLSTFHHAALNQVEFSKTEVYCHDTIFVKEIVEQVKYVYIEKPQIAQHFPLTSHTATDPSTVVHLTKSTHNSTKENIQVDLTNSNSSSTNSEISKQNEIQMNSTSHQPINTTLNKPVAAISFIHTSDTADAFPMQPIDSLENETTTPRVKNENEETKKIKSVSPVIKWISGSSPDKWFTAANFERPIIIKKGFTNRSSYGFGFGVSTHFKNDLVFSLHGSYSVLAFDSEVDSYIQKFPKVNPPSTEFNLEKIEVTIPSAEIDVNIDYLFPTHRRWRPFVGLGIGFTVPFTSLLTYEFSDPALAIEWLYEDSNPPRSSINLSVLGTAGIRYCLHHRWYMDLNAEYCNPLFSSTNIPERFKINLGLQYRFR